MVLPPIEGAGTQLRDSLLCPRIVTCATGKPIEVAVNQLHTAMVGIEELLITGEQEAAQSGFLVDHSDQNTVESVQHLIGVLCPMIGVLCGIESVQEHDSQ